MTKQTTSAAAAPPDAWRTADHYAGEIRLLLHAAARGDRSKEDAAGVAKALLDYWTAGK